MTCPGSRQAMPDSAQVGQQRLKPPVIYNEGAWHANTADLQLRLCHGSRRAANVESDSDLFQGGACLVNANCEGRPAAAYVEKCGIARVVVHDFRTTNAMAVITS